MRKKKVWRYYCDYCNKGSCSASGMKTHEKHCTLNPSRICRMCQIAGLKQQPTAKLVEAWNWGDINTLRSAADGCPACMLSAIRVWKKTVGESVYGKHSEECWDNWEYKDECDLFWSRLDEEERRREEWATY